MPEAKPAPAPQMGLTHAFGICVECIWNRVMKESLEGVEDMVAAFLEEVESSVGIAYWEVEIAGFGSGFRSKDILFLQKTRVQECCDHPYDVLMAEGEGEADFA
jgi:hypothetical protein